MRRIKLRSLVLGASLGLFQARPAKADRHKWEAQIRERVAVHQLREALQIVAYRPTEAPQDLEAAEWRARLLAWVRRREDAEAEYRRGLALALRNVGLLVGLASLLTWQQRYDESLSLLGSAAQIDPRRSEFYIAKAQVYRRLARAEQAREAFRHAPVLEPANAHARADLTSLDGQARYELHFWTDRDTFKYTNAAQFYTTPPSIRMNSRCSTGTSGVGEQRFGRQAGGFLGSVSYPLTVHNSLILGGGMAHGLSGSTSFSVGRKNFAPADQVGRLSARTFGGEIRYSSTRSQEHTNYVFTQDLSHGQTQGSFGFVYAIRF